MRLLECEDKFSRSLVASRLCRTHLEPIRPHVFNKFWVRSVFSVLIRVHRRPFAARFLQISGSSQLP
jgi:hypothetical protein